MKLPKRVFYYGVDEPPPERAALRAGPLSLIYESGDLRYVRLNGREILRRVYVAVRDRNWGTVPPRLSNVKMEVAPGFFRISYDVENRQANIDFRWKGTIVGSEDGSIRFAMEGVARTTFFRNRIGFCILHPVRECAGQPCVVEQVDGKILNDRFPLYISPHQPFLNMRAISHEVSPGVSAEVRMEGDSFETEDQRNWTDASYKTYCTPLCLPFPVEIKTGTAISQTVTLRLNGTPPAAHTNSESAGVVLTVRNAGAVPLPRLGLGMPSHGQTLASRAVARLRALNLSHLRVELRVSQPDFAAHFRRAATDAGELDVPLEIALFLSDAAEGELRKLRALLLELKPPVARWLILHANECPTQEGWLRLVRQSLASYDPRAELGAGTDANFAELNRARPPAGLLDWVCYSVNPQVHAFDNASLVENLEGQAAPVVSARQFTGGAHLAVSPITFRPRFNAAATGPEPVTVPGEIPPQVDVRQMSLFGAGWTLGSIKHLAESGADSVTYYETTGWRGVMESEQGSPVPGRFRSIPGAVFPLYHVLADVGEFAGGRVLPSKSNSPLAVEGLVLQAAGRRRILLANFTEMEQKVLVVGVAAGREIRLRSLDETNAESAMTSPESFRTEWREAAARGPGEIEVRLLPFATLAVDQTLY